MDFYTILKPEVEKAISGLAKELADAKRNLPLMQKHLLDKKAELSRKQDEKEKLIELVDKSIGKDNRALEKFQNSLVRKRDIISGITDVVTTFEQRIIPAATREVEESERKLKAALHTCCIQHKSDCEQKMNVLLKEIVDLQDDFFTCFDRIYADYGLQFVIHDINLIPRPTHARAELNIISRTAEQRAAALAEAMKPLAEGSLIPPEAGPQAVEAGNAFGEPLETKPETTLLTEIIVET